MLRLRLCALLLLVLLVYTAVASAEMQECDPVSAHPEGKIVCRPFGPSATSSVPSPPVASSDAIQQIGQLIDKYGEQAIIAFIRAKKAGHITLFVGNTWRDFYGSPNPSYVTSQTILYDLEALHLSPTKLEESLQEEAEWTEQKRQALARQRQQEEEEKAQAQAKAEAETRVKAQARAKAEAEAQAKWETEAKAKMKAEEERLKQTQAGGALPTAPQPSSSSKGNLSEWESACKSFGMNAKEAAIARDKGATYSQMLAAVRLAGLTQPNTLSRGIFEVLYSTMIKDLFERRWLTPERAQQEMEFVCMQSVSQGLSQR
jgi:flagellar biosynthesis GTPase FlhF